MASEFRGRGALGRAVRAARTAVARGTTAGPPPDWDPTQSSALYAWCIASGVETRSEYLWPLLHAAHVARSLAIPRICALEFGVAGGNGLVALERAAAIAASLSGTEIEIFGFDSGTGMPPPADPRDAPWLIEPSLFRMDEEALRARLETAQLVLGPVAETVAGWAGSAHPPIGFVAFDLDYYSSTVEALRVLDGDPERLLPRVLCYFDDLFGYGWSEHTGEHAAIAEFNADHERRKLGKIHGLRFELPPYDFQHSWHEKLYLLHAFDHPRYAEREGRVDARWEEAHRLRP